MITFLYLELNVLCMIVFFIMLCNFREKRIDKLNLDQFLFLILIIANILNIMFDSGMWLSHGLELVSVRWLHKLMAVLYYGINPLLFLVWLLYVEYKINRHRKEVMKKIPLYSIPFLFNALLVIASLWFPISFSIDAHNVYTREFGFFIMIVCNLIYLGYAFLIAIKEVGKKEWQLLKREFKLYVYFPLVMMSVVLLQIVIIGTSLLWAMSTVLLLSIFVSVQKNEIFTDYLTGLYNRKIIGDLLELKINKHKKDTHLFLALIDVDDFKDINDMYGHGAGDQALIRIADLLRKVCQDGDDIIVRLGGDEFLIAGERQHLHQVEYLKNNIHHHIQLMNEQQRVAYQLSLSIGFAVLDKQMKNATDLINAADQRMYTNKAMKKQSR